MRARSRTYSLHGLSRMMVLSTPMPVRWMLAGLVGPLGGRGSCIFTTGLDPRIDACLCKPEKDGGRLSKRDRYHDSIPVPPGRRQLWSV